MMDMLHPESREDIQRFQGMLTYKGKFIPSSCTALSSFGEDCRLVMAGQQKSFTLLKELITKAPVLNQLNYLLMPVQKA